MWPIATNVAHTMVCRSVCLCVGYMDMPCKMAEPTKMPFGELTRVGPRNYVLDSGRGPPWERAILEELSGPLKSMGSLCCRVRSKRDHCVISNGM